jgi:ribonuclease-3
VIRRLAQLHGKMTDASREFACRLDEGELTKLKSKLVSRPMLAHRIEYLGFHRYLIMNKGDFQNRVDEDESVREDLFEAILGAVALDCEWNWNVIDAVLDVMLPIERYLQNGFDTKGLNYVGLIQEWCQKRELPLPEYQYVTGFRTSSGRSSSYECTFRLRVGNDYRMGTRFSGSGRSKFQARMAAAEQAYRYLEKNNLLYRLRDVVGTPTLEKAVNQLQELSQKKYIPNVDYDYLMEYDTHGAQIWKCQGKLEGYFTPYWYCDPLKKNAKKKAALDMLRYVLGDPQDPCDWVREEEEDDYLYDNDD